MATACLPFGMKGAKRCSQTAGRLFVQFLINSFSPLVRSFIRPSSCPSIHPFSTYSFVYPSNIYLLIHSFIHSFCGYLGGNGLTALREVLSGVGGSQWSLSSPHRLAYISTSSFPCPVSIMHGGSFQSLLLLGWGDPTLMSVELSLFQLPKLS